MLTRIQILSFIHTYIILINQNIGKICVLLKAEVENNNENTKQFGKNLCMHIAASKPLALDVDKLDLSLIEKERDIQLATIKSSGKADNIIEKILEGKMNKYLFRSNFVKPTIYF